MSRKFDISVYPCLHSTFLPLTLQLHPSIHPISLFLHSHSQPSFHTRPGPGYVAVAMPGSQGQDPCYRLSCANPACIWDLFERSHGTVSTFCMFRLPSERLDVSKCGKWWLYAFPLLEKWPSISMAGCPCTSVYLVSNIMCSWMKFKSLLVHVFPCARIPVH